MEIKLAEALLRRKELQGKVAQLASIKDKGERRAILQFKRSIGVEWWVTAQRYDYDKVPHLAALGET